MNSSESWYMIVSSGSELSGFIICRRIFDGVGLPVRTLFRRFCTL